MADLIDVERAGIESVTIKLTEPEARLITTLVAMGTIHLSPDGMSLLVANGFTTPNEHDLYAILRRAGIRINIVQ